VIELQPTPNFASWSSIIGALPTAILPAITDPVLRGWLELILLRQEVTHVACDAIVRRLDSLPEALAASLIAGEGPAGAPRAGYQAACSLCRGEGCESATCRG
jgi:hypothetical protein